jgi:hypothetical protein
MPELEWVAEWQSTNEYTDNVLTIKAGYRPFKDMYGIFFDFDLSQPAILAQTRAEAKQKIESYFSKNSNFRWLKEENK